MCWHSGLLLFPRDSSAGGKILRLLINALTSNLNNTERKHWNPLFLSGSKQPRKGPKCGSFFSSFYKDCELFNFTFWWGEGGKVWQIVLEWLLSFRAGPWTRSPDNGQVSRAAPKMLSIAGATSWSSGEPQPCNPSAAGLACAEATRSCRRIHIMSRSVMENSHRNQLEAKRGNFSWRLGGSVRADCLS